MIIFVRINMYICHTYFSYFDCFWVKPTGLKNPSLLYNELGLSNLTAGVSPSGDKKSQVEEDRVVSRHVDSVIETIMDETRLSEGEGELAKVLGVNRSQSMNKTTGFPSGKKVLPLSPN